MILIGFLLGLTAGIPVWILVNRQKREMDQIHEFLDSRTGGRGDRRIRKSSGTRSGRRLRKSVNALIRNHDESRHKVQTLEDERRRFITDFSHDIRTPLTSMIGYIHLLLSTPPLSESDRRRFLDRLQVRGEELAALTEDFFALARLDAAEYPVTIEPVNLLNILRSKIARMQDLFTDTGLTIRIIPPGDSSIILADADAMNRILDNLLTNALIHAPAHSSITCTLGTTSSEVSLSLVNPANLRPSDIPQLFQRTFRGSRTPRRPGSGLGLTIVQQLCAVQNGRCHARLSPKSELEITLHFPRSL